MCDIIAAWTRVLLHLVIYIFERMRFRVVYHSKLGRHRFRTRVLAWMASSATYMPLYSNLVSCCRVPPSIMNSVLSEFDLKPLIYIHFDISEMVFSMVALACSWDDGEFGSSEVWSWASSANMWYSIRNIRMSTPRGPMYFVYLLGPVPDPWGMPVVSYCGWERNPL